MDENIEIPRTHYKVLFHCLESTILYLAVDIQEADMLAIATGEGIYGRDSKRMSEVLQRLRALHAYHRIYQKDEGETPIKDAKD